MGAGAGAGAEAGAGAGFGAGVGAGAGAGPGPGPGPAGRPVVKFGISKLPRIPKSKILHCHTITLSHYHIIIMSSCCYNMWPLGRLIGSLCI